MKKLISLMYLLCCINSLWALDDGYIISKRRMGNAGFVLDCKNFTVINRTNYCMVIRFAPVAFFMNNIKIETGFLESLHEQNGNLVLIDADSSKTIKLEDFTQPNGLLVSVLQAQYFQISCYNLIGKKIFCGQSAWIKFENNNNYMVTSEIVSSTDEIINLKLNVCVS
ncbi:MAG: hypothetical protein P4L22_07160 [Candidatus Babeliales bacterium]|nr:hypothetical protein [Candidatus Babeliales bacterium]